MSHNYRYVPIIFRCPGCGWQSQPWKLWDRFEGRIAQYPWASQRLTLEWIEPEELGRDGDSETVAQVEQLEMAL